MNAIRHLLHVSVRADRSPLARYTLAPPERRPAGVVVYEAVLASPGVSDYPELGIRERTPPEVLRDPAWLAGLAGLPIIDDPDLHWRGVTLADLPAARIGTILDARWDDAEQAVKVRLAIDTQRGIDLIARGVRGLSVTYTPRSSPVDGDPEGATHEQDGRHGSDHVLLTDTPRDIAARIRADARGGSMTPEQIAALKADIMAALGKRADAEGGEILAMLLDMLMSARSDAMTYKERADKLQADMDGMTAKAAEEDAMRADAAPRAKDWRGALDTAAKLGVEIKDDATLDDVRRAVVAKHLPARADATGATLADAYALTIEALSAAAKPGAAWRTRADAHTTDAPGVADLLTD